MGGLGRWLGYALLALATAAALLDGIDVLRGGDWRPASFLDWWSSLAPRTVDGVMLAWPWLTDTLLDPLVTLPAWAVLGVPGAILAIACRRNEDDQRRRRRRRARSH
jgi:hypothetical protein